LQLTIKLASAAFVPSSGSVMVAQAMAPDAEPVRITAIAVAFRIVRDIEARDARTARVLQGNVDVHALGGGARGESTNGAIGVGTAEVVDSVAGRR
jgi:hypothetical protein